MIVFCYRYSLLIEETGIGHLNSDPETILMGCFLLELKYIQGLCKQGFPAYILFLSLTCYLLSLFRCHLRSVNYIYNESIIH